MNYGNELNKIRNNSNTNLFNNFNYQTERINKKTLILDTAYSDCQELDINSDSKIGNINYINNKCINFRADLNELLNIDKECNVYIDNIYLLGSINIDKPIYLEIDELRSRSISNNPYQKNKYIILNKNSNDMVTDNKNILITGNSKDNFLTTINSKQIDSLNFSIITEDDHGKNIGIFINTELESVNYLISSLLKTDGDDFGDLDIDEYENLATRNLDATRELAKRDILTREPEPEPEPESEPEPVPNAPVSINNGVINTDGTLFIEAEPDDDIDDSKPVKSIKDLKSILATNVALCRISQAGILDNNGQHDEAIEKLNLAYSEMSNSGIDSEDISKNLAIIATDRDNKKFINILNQISVFITKTQKIDEELISKINVIMENEQTNIVFVAECFKAQFYIELYNLYFAIDNQYNIILENSDESDGAKIILYENLINLVDQIQVKINYIKGITDFTTPITTLKLDKDLTENNGRDIFEVNTNYNIIGSGVDTNTQDKNNNLYENYKSWATVQKSVIEIKSIQPETNAANIIDTANTAIETLNMIDEQWIYYDKQEIDTNINYFTDYIIKTPTPPPSSTSDNINDDCGCHTGDNNNILEDQPVQGAPPPNLLVSTPPPLSSPTFITAQEAINGGLSYDSLSTAQTSNKSGRVIIELLFVEIK